MPRKSQLLDLRKLLQLDVEVLTDIGQGLRLAYVKSEVQLYEEMQESRRESQSGLDLKDDLGITKLELQR